MMADMTGNEVYQQGIKKAYCNMINSSVVVESV
jgi:hypothetical protein